MDSRYFAFASYSGDDDDAYHRWVSSFCEKLQIVLRARLRDKHGEVHQYRRNGAAAGSLPEEMTKAIRRSAAMVLFIHLGWLESEECRKELVSFMREFGKQGLEDRRLLIVAMSKPAAQALVASQFWTEKVGVKKPVWIDFYRLDDDNRPLAQHPPDSNAIDRRYEDQMDKLVVELERCYRQAPKTTSPGMHNPRLGGRFAFGAVRDELVDEVARIAQTSSQLHGHEVLLFKRDDVMSGLPMLSEADTFVLAFNTGKPLLNMLPGGHLQVQAQAWLNAGKSPDKLLWLDLRHFPAEELASNSDLGTILDLAKRHLVSTADLIGCQVSAPLLDQAKIYIESNARELKHWDILGQAIRERWTDIARGWAPPLMLIHNALPVDEMERFSDLEDADGVIVLWGQKNVDSLRDQINKVQRWLPGFKNGTALPPRMIAYLMPPNVPRSETIPAFYWSVLRFNAETGSDALPAAPPGHWRRQATPEKICVVPEEATLLDEFLRDIFKRAQRKRSAVAPVPV